MMGKRGVCVGGAVPVGLAVLSGCAVSEAQGRVDPVDDAPEPTPANVPSAAVCAGCGADYLRENERLDLEDLAWSERNVTQEGLVGGSTFEYTAGDWVVRVSFPVVNPADTIYTVAIANTATGYEWAGEVDRGAGETSGHARPDETTEWFDAVRARDAALAFLSERYGERAPGLDLAWNETDATPGAPDKPLPGATKLRTRPATGSSRSSTQWSGPTWWNTRLLWSTRRPDSAGQARSRPAER